MTERCLQLIVLILRCFLVMILLCLVRSLYNLVRLNSILMVGLSAHGNVSIGRQFDISVKFSAKGGKIEDRLHNALSKGGGSNNGSKLIIAECRNKDLRGTRCVFIAKYNRIKVAVHSKLIFGYTAICIWIHVLD